MQTTQWDSWYWDYHAAARRLGCEPLPQSNRHLQRVYREFCEGKDVNPARRIHRVVCRYIERPQGRANHPLVDRFVFTGEKFNPWRCSGCATKKQREQADKHPVLAVSEHGDRERPQCCRKCSMDYMR